MKFQSGKRRRALEYEKDWVARWKADRTFEKSVDQRPKDNSYVFYDGPPFISGVPHHGTLLSSIVKDAVPRYHTMKGKRVERVWGWDCHGLPAERYTEKKLGIQSREEVLEYGIEKYILACRANMVQTSSEWEDTVDRIGRWVDFKGAYKTMDKDYMESVWWAFKTLHEKGKIYEGEKVLMYCTLDATPLSKAEVTMDAGAYQDVTDPSVYVKFKLKSEPRALGHEIGDKKGDTSQPLYMLAWTTTPWTLPANTALAINPELEYEEYILDGERVIIAQAAVGQLANKFAKEGYEYGVNPRLVRCFKGENLIGLEYEPLLGIDRGKGAHRVWAADYVTADSGTGIVHLAPAYGEEDFELAQKEGIPVVHVIDANGLYTESDWLGQNVWEANKPIAKALLTRGIVWKIDYYRHSYPHCHRCGTRLMYRAHPSWFMDIDGQRQKMFEKNEPINWFPSHLKHGRFEKTIQQAPDWNLSRDRFWATAMPVWKSNSGKVKVIGSYAELTELAGVELEDYHRPWIDDVTFELQGETYTRIDKVMDSWFEAGSMSFAQFHYPFENKAKFEANFPGDFIVEYIAQTRAWFYYMHAVSVALFGEFSFRNVITTGTLAGNDGRKMSKSYGNYTDPNELMDKFSADSLRFLLLSSPLLNGEDFALHDKEVGDVARKLSMVWNMYDFFTLYAEADDFTFPYASSPSDAFVLNGTSNTAQSDTLDASTHTRGEQSFVIDVDIDKLNNPLDIWIISRLHQLVGEVEMHMDGYNIPDALSPILPFLDDASNWYVRRSRRRFWKSEDDADKQMAYRTLHYVLVRLSYVLAPFTPFLAEELYHNLTGDEESIHLKDWLPAGHVDQIELDRMTDTREIINLALSQRAQLGLKVRQPLAKLTIEFLGQYNRLSVEHERTILEEVNVKTLTPLYHGDEHVIENSKKIITAQLDTALTTELKREGLMREVVRHVQAARKAAGLNVDDRIALSLKTTSTELQAAIAEHDATIATETLAQTIDNTNHDYQTTVKVDAEELTISLEKV